MFITIFNAISHFLVDAACVAALFSFGTDHPDFGTAILVYNTVAFSTQCLVGMLLDRAVRRDRLRSDALLLYGSIQAFAMFLVAAASLLTFEPIVKAAVTGIGNSFFHVSGGSVSLDRSGGKAAPLGVFVAPGAFGVTIGTLFPGVLDYVGLLLGLAAIFCFGIYRRFGQDEEPDAGEGERYTELRSFGPIFALTAAVAVRAIGGTAAVFTWKTGAVQALLLTLFVFLGKFLGGFVCD
ncbi:MAG: hypothetical protein J5535_02670, partial [Firmicutes bacterium]|nr:hypothetical protein [Bacillota bacterium]